MEYDRKVGGSDAAVPNGSAGPPGPAGDARIMAFGSVFIAEKDPGGAPRQSNVRYPSSDFTKTVTDSQGGREGHPRGSSESNWGCSGNK